MNEENKLQAAMERIKRLECPTADIEERVAGILADFGVSNANNVEVEKEEDLKTKGAQVFRATLKSTGQSIVFLVVTGADDYVAKVVGVTEI